MTINLDIPPTPKPIAKLAPIRYGTKVFKMDELLTPDQLMELMRIRKAFNESQEGLRIGD